MELVMKVGIDIKESGLDPDKVKGNLTQFVRDLLIIGAAEQEIGLTLRETSLVETDGETQETDDLISRKAVIDAIKELLQSPYVNDSYFMGRKEAIEMTRDMCVKCQPSAYDATKAKERIKEEIGTCDFSKCNKYLGNCNACAEERATEIVKSGFVNRED